MTANDKREAEKILRSHASMRKLPQMLEERYGAEKAEVIYRDIGDRLASALEDHKDDSKALRRHSHATILPLMAAYTALCQVEPPEDALRIVETMFLEGSQGAKKALHTMFRLPGLYRRAPGIFTAMTKRNFGEDAGFVAEYLQSDASGMAFDMHRCPYHEICKEYGCPELTGVFCRADDVLYGDMHPKLEWARTQTIGEGAASCDFRIWVKD